MKTCDFRFYDPKSPGDFKIVRTPADAPFKFVAKFAAEEFNITSRIKSVNCYKGKPVDLSLPAEEVLIRFGYEAHIVIGI